MSDSLIERLVEKRNKLPLNWGVPIEDEAVWWANAIADQLEAQPNTNPVQTAKVWLRHEITEHNNK